MDTQVSPAVVVVVLIIVTALLIALYLVVFQPEAQTELLEEGSTITAPPTGPPPTEPAPDSTSEEAAGETSPEATNPSQPVTEVKSIHKKKPLPPPADDTSIKPNPRPRAPVL